MPEAPKKNATPLISTLIEHYLPLKTKAKDKWQAAIDSQRIRAKLQIFIPSNNIMLELLMQGMQVAYLYCHQKMIKKLQ